MKQKMVYLRGYLRVVGGVLLKGGLMKQRACRHLSKVECR